MNCPNSITKTAISSNTVKKILTTAGIGGGSALALRIALMYPTEKILEPDTTPKSYLKNDVRGMVWATGRGAALGGMIRGLSRIKS